MANPVLPWWNNTLEKFAAAVAANKLPHAILLTGSRGLGLETLALEMGSRLICMQPDSQGSACGACKACKLIEAQSHPDYRTIFPEEEGKAIKVDQVREFGQFVSLSSQFGGWKIGIVSPADAMNVNAANSLLKTLEEPQGNTLIILVSENPARLLPTIRSRCQAWQLNLPEESVINKWLAEQGVDSAQASDLIRKQLGGPLALLDWFDHSALWKEQINGILSFIKGNDEIAVISDKWSKDEFDRRVMVTQWVLLDAMKAQQNIPVAQWQNPELEGPIKQLSEKMSADQLHHVANIAMKLTKNRLGQANPQLLWEEFLINCKNLPTKQLRVL